MVVSILQMFIWPIMLLTVKWQGNRCMGTRENKMNFGNIGIGQCPGVKSNFIW